MLKNIRMKKFIAVTQ